MNRWFSVRVTLGWAFCVSLCSFFALSCEACAHWFVFPVALCGMVLIPDVLDWLTGKSDLFDPVAIIALLGLHFFFVAPILHVNWDSWMLHPLPPGDWRPWLGYMGIVNLVGLLIYQHIVHGKSKGTTRPWRRYWRLSEDRFWIVCVVLLAVSMLAQTLVYYQFGGVQGYIHAYEMRDYERAFRGMGWIFMISESFPILAFMCYTIASQKHSWFRKWPLIIAALLTFSGLGLLFGGLRGSRSNTIWGLFWAAGIVHFVIRPLKRSLVFTGLVVLVGFMFFYGLYKSYGLEALREFGDPRAVRELALGSNRTLKNTLLMDFGRSDVQALLLYRICDNQGNYEYAMGTTYLNSLLLLIPKPMRPKLGRSKVEAGTDAQYGYYSDDWISSKVYGLAGEALLNFGIFSVPFAFALFGWFIARMRRFLERLPTKDVRRMLAPVLINLAIVLLVGDSDNILFFLVKYGVVPFLLLYISSQRMWAPVLSSTAQVGYIRMAILAPRQ